MTARGNPILVTGAHRSGTTWLGRLLATHEALGYVHEPFNARVPGVYPAAPEHFVHINADNGAQWDSRINDIVHCRYPLARHASSLPARREARIATEQWRAMRQQRGKRLLVKDPLAIFAAEYLHQRHNFSVIATVRNPCGFVSSVLRLNWRIPSPARHLLAQPGLAEFVAPFADQLNRVAARDISHIDEAILIWRVFNTWIAQAAERNPQWVVVRTEDIAADPLVGVSALLAGLDLAVTQDVLAGIRPLTEGPAGDSFLYNDVFRDSSAVTHAWRTRLEPDQIERIAEGTADVAQRWYSLAALEMSD